MKKKLLLPILFLLALGETNAQFINEGWHTKAPMPAGKWGVGSASYQVGPEGRLVPISGADPSFLLSTIVYNYSSTTNAWSTLPNIPEQRYQVNSFYHNNKIYCIGGYTGGTTATSTVSIYDIVTNSWSTGTPMPTAVGDYASVQNGDLIYIICGRHLFTDFSTVQVYNTVTNTWSLATPFNGAAVSGGRAGIAKGKIVFVGGYSLALAATQSQARLGTIDPVNPLLITWTALPNYPAGPAGRHAAGSVKSPLNTTVYFTGGDPNGAGTAFMNATWGYDVVEGQWKSGPNKTTAVSNVMSLAPIVANDTLFYACNGGYSGVVETANEWLKIGRASGITTTVTGNPTKCPNQTDTIIATNLDTNLRWQSSTDNISFTFISGPAGTNDTLFTGPLTQSTWYRVVSYGHVDSAISPSFAVTVLENVAIGTQPTVQTVCAGASASFSVSATGTGLTYQWRKNGNPISDNGTFSGTNSASLSISDATNEAGSYDVVVTGTCSTVTSTGVALTVNPLPTATLTNNGAATICDGTTVSIDINFTGTAPYDFNYFDGTVMQSETGWATNTFNFTPTPSATTTYLVSTITDDNLCSGTGTNTADVTVEYPIVIGTDPASITPCTGASANFSVAATGGGLGYQWYNGATPLTNTVPYSGADANALNISDVTGLDNNTFYVDITNTCGTVSSATATLSENFENTWVGGSGTSWSNSPNWSCGTLPTILTNVTVPSTAATMPNVNILVARCNDITIDAGAAITFSSFNAQLEVAGDIINDGDFYDVTGKILLSGTDQTLSGPITIGDMEIDGGGNKTLAGNLRISNLLTYTSGYLILGGHDLTLETPWTQTGAGTASFVVTNDTGSVFAKNMGNDTNPEATWFHVGIDITSYTPLYLENTGDQDSFKVRVFEHVYVDGIGDAPEEVANPVVDRTWMISEYTDGGSFVSITPYWNAGDETTNFDLDHVYVAHYMNDEWTSEIDSAMWAPAADGTDPYSATEDSITVFSPFTVASYAQFPLGIKLTTISATNAGTRNRIDWKSAKEANSDKYDLERSIDGILFKHMATVAANGKASTYTQWDENAVVGVNYYRVKMTDANGKYTYSKVVSATVNPSDIFGIEAFPNPVKNTVSIKVNGAVKGKGTVTVTDVTGKLVKATTELNGNKADINVSELSSGVYLINYSDDIHNESVKINKQ